LLGFAALSGVALKTWIDEGGLGGGLGKGGVKSGVPVTLNRCAGLQTYPPWTLLNFVFVMQERCLPSALGHGSSSVTVFALPHAYACIHQNYHAHYARVDYHFEYVRSLSVQWLIMNDRILSLAVSASTFGSPSTTVRALWVPAYCQS
jgi:hypothetical protein